MTAPTTNDSNTTPGDVLREWAVDAQLGEPPAGNVIEALRRVIRDLPAIGKEGTGPASQGGYKYRGIEQITRHAAPLFAKHGLVMAPYSIVWRPTREILVNEKPSTDESLMVTYRVYGPGGVDDFIEVQTPGIGRDSSDKGSNKAMTAAYKYALTQMLTVADEKDDSDATSLEADAPYTSPPERPEQMTRIRELCDALRERGDEVTERNDLGEVTVLGVQLLERRDDNRLYSAVREQGADDLIKLLNARLADALIAAAVAAADAPGSPVPASESATGEGDPTVPPAGEAPTRPSQRTPEQAEREQVAREALLQAETARKPKAKTKAPAGDEPPPAA